MHDFRLGAGDVLQRAEIFQMRFAHIGDDGDIRLHHAGEQVDLAAVLHAHLHHGHLILL